MDNLSSSDLDTSSKTPLFVGIAAVIVALTGVALGWLGFSKASALEAQLAELSGATASVGDLKSSVEGNTDMIRKAAGKLTSIESSLKSVTKDVGDDISSVKKDMRTLAIQAGTALKKVEALEERGVKAAAPKPAPVVSSSEGAMKSSGSELTGETKIHVIAAGDIYANLSTRYNVSVNDLIDANPGVDPRRLRIGQEIVIPVTKE